MRPKVARWLRLLANRISPTPPLRIPFNSGLDYAAMMSRAQQLADDIYHDVDRPDLKNGRPSTYNAAARAEHRNHLHFPYSDGGNTSDCA